MNLGVFCSFSVFMLFGPLSQVFCVASIEGSICTEKNVNVERQLPFTAPYIRLERNRTRYLFALLFLDRLQGQYPGLWLGQHL